jgi:hypothetical protein
MNPGKILPGRKETTVWKQGHHKIIRKNSLQNSVKNLNNYTPVKFPNKQQKILADYREFIPVQGEFNQ